MRNGERAHSYSPLIDKTEGETVYIQTLVIVRCKEYFILHDAIITDPEEHLAWFDWHSNWVVVVGIQGKLHEEEIKYN